MRKTTKKNTTLLLVLVLFIWGLLLYMLFNAFFKDNKQSSTTIHKYPSTQKIDLIPIERQHFTLQHPKRDPFFTIQRSIRRKTPVPKPSVVKKETKNVKVTWPRLKYNGMISSDSENKVRIFFIEVDNKELLFKPNKAQGAFILIEGNEKEVTLEYQSQRKKVKRSE